MTYPKWVQRDQNVGPVLCQNEAEEKALLDAWKAEQGATDAPEPTVAELRVQLDARGLEYDARWGAKRLQEAIAAATAADKK